GPLYDRHSPAESTSAGATSAELAQPEIASETKSGAAAIRPCGVIVIIDLTLDEGLHVESSANLRKCAMAGTGDHWWVRCNLEARLGCSDVTTGQHVSYRRFKPAYGSRAWTNAGFGSFHCRS